MTGPSEYLAAEQALWSSFGVAPTEHRVTLPGGNDVRIQEVGEGPPVLFIHGVSVAGASWVHLASALRNDFRCLLIDRPGCGLSDPIPDGPLTSASQFKRHAEALAPAILDELALESAALACTSMGGFFGFRAAIAHSERFTKVVEYSWTMGTPMAKVPLAMRIGSIGPMKAFSTRMPISAPAVKFMLKQVGMKRAIESGAFDQRMVDWVVSLMRHTGTLKSETDNNTFISLGGENPEFLFTDVELQQVSMPVLLLWGDEDTNGGPKEAERFAARLPNARLEVIPQAGHAPWIDEPELCADRTRTFLRG